MKLFNRISLISFFINQRLGAFFFGIFLTSIVVITFIEIMNHGSVGLIRFALAFCYSAALASAFYLLIQGVEVFIYNYEAKHYTEENRQADAGKSSAGFVEDFWNDETRPMDYIEAGEGTSIANSKKSSKSLDDYSLDDKEVAHRSKTLRRWRNKNNHP